MAKAVSVKKEKKHPLTIIAVIVIILLIPIIICNSIMIIKGYTNPDKVPDISGYSPMLVLTGSMEPTIGQGDLVIVKATAPEEIKEGDIISFYDPASQTHAVVTHRVEKIETNDEGRPFFFTKGDANESGDLAVLSGDDVIGVVTKSFSNLGSVVMFMQTAPGYIICIGIPFVILIAADFIPSSKESRNRKKRMDEMEEELRRLKEEQQTR